MKFLRDLRRRRVLRLGGLYIVGAWVAIEVASVFFPAWGIPDTALRYLFIAAALLFPVALVFAWIFDITPAGIVRTRPAQSGETADLALQRSDYVTLIALALVAATVIYGSLERVVEEPTETPVANQVERVRNSIAVLPFRNLDAERETEYFSDGITEEILHRLSTLRQLHVLASTSSFAFRNSEESTADISAKLGVEYLLHGSVRRDGRLVRVTARLLDQTGEQVWSESFDRKLEAIFAIQSEIAGNVASQIIREMTGTGGTRPSTSNPEAYDEYLLGRSYTRTRADGWHDKSEAAFRHAIELDPDFAPAHAGLAYSLFVNRGREHIAEALAAAQKAIELDPGLAEGQAILGALTLWNGDPYKNAVEAERYLNRALELDPSYPETYTWLSGVYQFLEGHEAEYAAVLEKGYAIDPLSPALVLNLADHYAREGDFERAERMKLRLTQLPEPPWMVGYSLWRQYTDWGRFADALQWAEGYWQGHMLNYAALGMTARANALLADNAGEDPRVWFGTGADVLGMQGRHDAAMQRLLEALDSAGESLDTIPPNGKARAIVILAAAGRYEEPLRLYEEWGAGNLDTFGKHMETGLYVDAATSLAFAYQEAGQAGDARAILDALLNNEWLRTMPQAPRALATIARLRTLAGDTDGAYEALREAVALGWADYVAATNDPRWRDTLEQPRFVELFNEVQANLAEQRATVEQLKAEAG